MSRSLIERRLTDVADRLKQLRVDLGVADEQLLHFVQEADDARLRSLVSETPLAEREHRDAARHAAAIERSRSEVAEEIRRLEGVQDDLLDELTALGRPAPTPPLSADGSR
jgi:hypothetical protein